MWNIVLNIALVGNNCLFEIFYLMVQFCHCLFYKLSLFFGFVNVIFNKILCLEMANCPSNDLIIGGISVKFPCKPYPSQLSMMSKIIRGLQNGKHCLLESPTGSGKTLALLCSALAWQEEARKKLESETLSNGDTDKDNQASCNDSAEDFQGSKCCQEENRKPEKRKVPTVYFGTRTHKQIAQITQELSRTAYKNLYMTILSSREHSCIHPVNEKSKNKNDGCRDLLKGRHADLPNTRCSFYSNVHRIKTHTNLYSCGLTSAWDLEDFVKLGRRVRACPYFASRELLPSSAIVFCPYNYLVDPGIRSSMNINLKDQIIILDEAHNIEDCSRDAASNTLKELDLINAIADLDHLISENVKEELHKPLHLLCTKIGQWLQARAATLSETSYETWSQIWSGQEFLSCLAEWGITADTLPVLQKCFTEATSSDDEVEEEEYFPKILHSASQALLGGLFRVLSYLLYAEKKYVHDYRIAIIRTAEYGVPPPKRTRDGWIALNKRSTRYFSVNLHFWCLNPAVAFSQFDSAHSVILTSGTLSPMLSFSSELGLSFPIQLEASHVISDSQVWVGTVGSGPNGHHLQATYQNTNALSFQDELGKLILSVCTVVPHGVLCFFSSYKMLEKLCERWDNTGLWAELSEKKGIFSEPHGKNKSDFQEVLQSFYTFTSSKDSRTGALLLAVCRGKISEGIDFSDDNARAVITVGIPFPNFKDQQVELKRKYNDEHSKSRGLLSGSDWYEIQAFRALNQALGRCIRHKNDWGALIIVDDRFCKNPKRYCKGLSKWVRSKVKTFPSFQSATDSLAAFCHHHEFAPDLSISEITDNSEADKTTFDSSTHNESSIVVHSDRSYLDDSSNTSRTSIRASVRVTLEKEDRTSKQISPVKQTKKFPISSRPSEATKTRSVPCDDFVAEVKPIQLDEVIVIPSTPEKQEKVLVIPESPEDFYFKDDFKSESSKRKVPVQSSSISNRLAKKCKQSLDFASKNCENPSATIVNASTNDSQELFAPRTRRKRSLKANRKEERKSVNKSKSVDSTATTSVQSQISCIACKAELLTPVTTPNPILNPFNYIQSAFSNAKNLVPLPLDHKNNLTFKTMQSSSDAVKLDAVWCPIQHFAYQFYICKSCQSVLAFSVMNSDSHSCLYLISSKVKIL